MPCVGGLRERPRAQDHRTNLPPQALADPVPRDTSDVGALDGLLEVIRFRDAKPNEKGFLVYSALYMLARENLHETAEWKARSDLGRWAPVIRPKVKSRARRAGPVVARFRKPMA